MLYRHNVLFFLCFFSTLTMLNAKYETPKNLNDIPKYCKSLAEQLKQSPLFEGHTQEKNYISCSYLCLDSWDDCRICDILSKNAQKIRNDAWKIRDFGCGNRGRFISGKWIGWGIEMYGGGVQCSSDELLETYNVIVMCLKKGWTEMSVVGCHKKMSIKLEQGYRCFIKTQQLIEEPSLIRSLISRFGIGEFVECKDFLLESNKVFICLLIKNENGEIDKVKGILNDMAIT
jgi:hypothetical protein